MTRSAKGTIENPGTNVAQKSGLNREILASGWGDLVRFSEYKALRTGTTVVRVPAAFTARIGPDALQAVLAENPEKAFFG